MNPDILITSRTQFHEALRGAFAEVAEAPCRELWLCDEDFARAGQTPPVSFDGA